MSGVNADPPTPSAAGPDYLDGKVPEQRKHKPMLSDEELLEKHRGQPERGNFTVEVRRAIIDRYQPRDPFSAFAQQIKLTMIGSVAKGDQGRVRGRLSETFRDPAGPNDLMVTTVLLLTVEDIDREARARRWTEQYALAHPKKLPNELPDFVENIRHPERYMKPGKAPLATSEARLRAPVEEQPAEPADQDDHRQQVPTDRERILREYAISASLELDVVDPFVTTSKRYRKLRGNPAHDKATDEEMDSALRMLMRYFYHRPEILEPEEDFVRTASRWQETARDQPITVGLPLAARRVISIIMIVIWVLGLLSYVVVVFN